MNNLTALQSRKKNIARLNRNSKLFKSILTAIKDKKAENIVSLDLRKIPEAVADFFVICQASNAPQLKAIADNVEAEAKKNCNELYKYCSACNAARAQEILPTGRNVERCAHDTARLKPNCLLPFETQT